MNTITCTDLTDATYNAKLLGHLKSEDFFNVEKYAQSKFVIKSVKEVKSGEVLIKGNLTIKGITHEIEFPAKVKNDGKQITTTAKITVDRSKYDIRYGSKSFFEGLGDKMIYDEFDLNLKLVADYSNL
jgi:polyisoprenoid-binding protein YceI